MNFRALIAGLLIMSSFLACNNQKQKVTVDPDQVREYAGDLVNRELFTQAIEQYKFYLDSFSIQPRERANVNYIVANLYFDRLKDYENALAYYLKIKHYYPDSPLMDQVNKRIIACLERLERSADAQQVLDEAVQLDQEKVHKSRPGAVVAKIGDREITSGDLNFEINQLPPSVREQISSPQKKIDFLREFVATELMYDTAKRAGLDKDPEVIEGAFQSKKMLMVSKLLKERVGAKIHIDQNDIQLYWDANKEKYAEKNDDGEIVKQPTLDQVKDQVYQDLYGREYTKAYQDLINRMVQAENVQFYTDRVN
jgi:tetratricopeptide (TPR) repeat protein